MNRLKHLIKIAIVLFSATSLMFSSYLSIVETALAAETDHAEEVYNSADNNINTNFDDPGETEVNSGRNIDPIQNAAEKLEAISADKSNTLSTDVSSQWSMSKLSNLSSTPKLVLNTNDQQDLRILSCLGNVIPDYANDLQALSIASSKGLDDLQKLKSDHPDQFATLIHDQQNIAKNKIAVNLRSDLKNFACIAGVDEITAANMIKDQPDNVTSIINYAQNNIVIDRRVLELLVNLVTPKNQGGAGHERIKVYRIRNNYGRDTRMFSRESDAIRQDIADSQKQSQSTVGDLSSTPSDAFAQDPAFASAEARAAVIDSAGRNQGELIFSSAESDANISAHNKGEAVDISEVDNIKCTLIKKKRLGSDSKTAQPPTPIKLAWQTSEGYDNSPPPNYTSLNANLQQLASGEFLDLLDEFDISADSTENFSSYGFSDIVGLIGKSLIGELINSPGTAISGATLSATVQKIGAIVLADKFSLPRSALVDADLSNISDLETKIGEANFEQKLNLPYGSIRGKNLGEIFYNIGIRHTETEFGVPAGTLAANMSPAQLQLTTGQRTIESELNLPAKSFATDTNYAKLKSAAGSQKVDLLFANPSQIDEALKIDFGISAAYKSGAKSPDQYATTVGAKVLADNVYLYGQTTSAGNALNLASNLQTGTVDTGTAALRLQNIMGGTADETTYRSLGIEFLSQAMSANSDTRVALMQWMAGNASVGQTNCPITSVISQTIPKSGAPGQTINITIPEDQIMSSFNLRRGDLTRLFGCSDSTTSAVFKSLGTTILYNSVKNSSLAQQAESRFLSDHPEISSVLQDVDFYKSRIDTIKNTTTKIKNDWNGYSADDPAVAQIKDLIAGPSGIGGIVFAIDTGGLSSTNLQGVVNQIRRIPITLDKVQTLLDSSQNSNNQSLRDKANGTLADINSLIRATDEVLTGQNQPDIFSLQMSDISSTGNANASSSNQSQNTSINRATLALMLSGRLSPKDFLISLGSNMIETSLDLPSNSLLYFAKYEGDGSRNKDDDKNAFFRAIGQAQLEESLSLPPFFFQGDLPAKDVTLTEVKNHVASAFSVSPAEAGAQIMKALRLPGEFSTIESREVSSISSVILASNQIDSTLNIKSGTTANFLNGKAIQTNSIGNSDIQMLSGKLGIPEQVIRKFTRVKNGDESLSQAKEDNYAGEISYNFHNPFAAKPAENASNVGSCPITFTYSKQNGLDVSLANGIQDTSYVYTDANGTKSFKSISNARDYENKNQDAKIDFVQALSIGLNKNADGTVNKDKANQFGGKISSFLNDKTAGEPLSNTDLDAVANAQGIPSSLLSQFLNRNKDSIGQKKPIGPYLEMVGKRTAETRIISAVIGDIGFSIAGQQIDASDIYNLLSGNSMEVAYRIGSRYLEKHFDVSENAVIQLLESPTQTLRNCSLSRIGGNLVGSFVGVNNLDLSGNIYENIGGAKIEQALGLPVGSFHGASLAELQNNIGPLTFARAFSLPTDKLVGSDQLAGTFSDSVNQSLSQVTGKARYDRVQSLLDNPDAASLSLSKAKSLDDKISGALGNFSTSLASDSNLWAYNTSANSFGQIQINMMQSRATEIDGTLGLAAGSTKDLLTGKTTPDSYRHKVADATLKSLAVTKVLDLLGITGSNIFDGQKISSLIGTCRSASGCKSGDIFNAFTQIFGSKIDAKLNLPYGTFAGVIADPQRAKATIIGSALARLDGSLGLDPNSNASFTAAYRVTYGAGGDYRTCQNNPAGCLQTSSDDAIFAGFSFHERWQYFSQQIGGALVGNYLVQAGLLPSPAQVFDGTFHQASADLIANDGLLLIHGDMRVVKMAAMVKAAESLHIYGGSTTVNLPPQYRITYEDIRIAFLGDSGYENRISAAAEANFANVYNDHSENLPSYLSPPTEDTELAAVGLGYLDQAQCPPGVSSADCFNPDQTTTNYTTYSHLGSLASRYDQQNPINPAVDINSTLNKIHADPAAEEQLNSNKEFARSKARDDMQKILLYRMSDAKLYELDKHIPVGLTETMLTGNGFEKTFMMMGWVKNSLRDLSLGGISLNDLGTLQRASNEFNSFMGNPQGFDLNAFASSGELMKLDSYLVGKVGNLFGFQMQTGTFTALAYGLKTHNFKDDVKITGADGKPLTLPSLRTMYTDWAIGKVTAFADNMLGLPTGTAYQTYTMYKQIVAAKELVGLAPAIGAAANLVAPGTGDAVAKAVMQKAQAKIAEVKAGLISFIVSTVFSKQVAQLENSLGLAIGSGSMLVGLVVSYIMFSGTASAWLASGWVGLAVFVLTNLFGVYDVKMVCTADGYYPGIDQPADPGVVDNGSLGVFDGLNPNTRKAGFVKAAQYKARTLAGDGLMLTERTGDELAIPSQIMTGRQEDVDYWNYKVEDVICSKIGGCADSRAGLWANPQTTAYTHIGF